MPMRRRLFLTASIAVAAVLTSRQIAFSQTDQVYTSRGVAVDGTDVVAYFTKGEPVAGSSDLSVQWKGATWHFSTAQNRDAFERDPERFAPQYGGFCAYAVSEGYTASTTPEAWRIVDDKLYLNYSRRIQRRWERDIPGRITAADANWPSVVAK